ncbi:hypothetical protein RB595_004464 [Gaeumannomyces hyphopodioides]
MAKLVTRTIGNKLFTQPMAPPDSFKGQRVLVTGGTTGLGLATAIHVVGLGAAAVSITCRDAARGEAARKRIVHAAEVAAKKAGAGAAAADVRVLELDMSVYSSVVAFADTLKRDFGSDGGFDWICLNAGVIDAAWSQSPEGWVPTLQVNVLSTVLLAQLLLPWLKSLRGVRARPAHLTLVGSGMHLNVDVSKWPALAEKSGGILRHFSARENFRGQELYAVSKLMLQHALAELARAALDPATGAPAVVVNTCCPGMVRTEISRSMKEESLVVRLGEPLLMSLLAQTPEVGARTYLAAGLTTESENGKFICKYIPDKDYAKESVPVLTSETGQKVHKLLWDEIQQELTSKVPALKQL